MNNQRRADKAGQPKGPKRRRPISFYLFGFAALFAALVAIELLLGVGLSRQTFGRSIDRVRTAERLYMPLAVAGVAAFVRWYEKRKTA